MRSIRTAAACALALLAFAGRPAGAQDCSSFDEGPVGFLSTFGTGGWITDLAWSAPLALLANADGRVDVCDVGDPSAPLALSSFATPGPALTVVFRAPYALAACGPGGVAVWNLADPASPQPATWITANPFSFHCFLNGDALYVSDHQRVTAYNASSMESPALLWTLNTPPDARRIAGHQGLLYVANGASGLTVIDPGTVTVAGTLPLPGFTSAVVVRGERAYAACGTAGVSVLDTGDPLHPAWLSSQPVDGVAGNVVLDGSILYVLVDDGCLVCDVTVPGALRLLGRTAALVEPASLAFDGDRALVPDALAGLKQFWRPCGAIALAARPQGDDLLLSWVDPRGSAWRVERSPDCGSGPGSWELLARTTDPLFVDAGAVPLGRACYRVVAEPVAPTRGSR